MSDYQPNTDATECKERFGYIHISQCNPQHPQRPIRLLLGMKSQDRPQTQSANQDLLNQTSCPLRIQSQWLRP